MNCFDKYEELLKNDDDGALFKSILSAAERKLLNGEYDYDSYSDNEIMTLAYSLKSFRVWDIGLDYWDMDQDEVLEDFQKNDILSEYPSRKLCCLIDTLAPVNEIEKWYNANLGVNSRMMFYGERNPSEVEKKLLDYHDDTAEHFAESLSNNDIRALLNNGSEFVDPSGSKYQIVSQYIRGTLCDMIDQRDSMEDIEKWYKVFLAFHYYS